MKQCIFCTNELVPAKSGSERFSAFICRDCLSPKYNSLYRQLYLKGENDLLVDLTVIDNVAISRYFKAPSDRLTSNYSIIYRRPLTKGVYKISHIVPIDTSNIERLKHKLTTWITFS